MTDFLAGLGVGEIFGAFTLIVFVRAQATYWVARGAVTGAGRTPWGRSLQSPALERGARILAKWGPPAVTLSFLTIGFQTLINAAAGASKMQWRVYLVAMLPGCLIWAGIYSTIGFAVLWATVGAAAGSPAGLTVIIAVALPLAALITVRLLRLRARPRVGVTS